MRIVSWNVNGIRACVKKGFMDYLSSDQPDYLCIQESKIQEKDLEDHIEHPPGYRGSWVSAEKKGYSGTAILTNRAPLDFQSGFGVDKYDSEGRVMMADLGDTIIFSVYFPNGQRDDERLNYKLSFYDAFFTYCESLRKEGKSLIICGDYNTAHSEIDLANPKQNQKTSGFLPIEREWLDKIVSMGYIDTFREFNTQAKEYSWWSYRGGARDRNVGWRIDYVFITPELRPKLKDAFILQSIMGSDHCPVGIEIDL